MFDVLLDWNFIIRTIIPFGAANILIWFLLYFSLVRYRLGASSRYYAVFVVCFVLFLYGPIVIVMTIDVGKRWFDIIRNILLFSAGIPALTYALYLHAKNKIPRGLIPMSIVLGITWSVFFLLTLPLPHYQAEEISWLYQLSKITNDQVYISQTVLISVQILFPIVFLLTKPIAHTIKLHCYGIIAICICMVCGNLLNNWEVYYGGCSLSVLIWGAAVYRDIQNCNQKLKQHYLHQGSLAIAQFTASSNMKFSDFYPSSINEAYPFRERAALLESTSVACADEIEKKCEKLFEALNKFTQNKLETYRLRAKELLFMLFDKAIFNSGNSASLISRLEEQRNLIDAAQTIAEINQYVQQQAKYLGALQYGNSNSLADTALVDRIKTYILSHYHEDISIDDIAESVGASRSYVTRTFKHVATTTINHYLVNIRITKAKALLQTHNIADTAFNVGFNNPTYFSTVFKKREGKSPTEYQQALQNEPSQNKIT